MSAMLAGRRWVLPSVVTAGALWWVFDRIGLREAAAVVTLDALIVLVPALLVFAAAALAIEAECLFRLLPPAHAHESDFDHATAARIKAASYPLALIHYAIGAAGLGILLSRRTGRSIAEATGIVALIALFDVGVQLLMMVAGVTALGTDAPAVQAGVAVAAIGAIFLGFFGLRTPISLGPLDRIRNLSILDAARTTRIPLLAQLAFFRFLFALCFLGLIGAACRAFDVDVPATYLLASVPVLIVVAMLPSIAGLGTGQVAFIEVFGRYAPEETLLACSLALSTGLIIVRAAIGLIFAREFTREAFVAASEDEPPEVLGATSSGRKGGRRKVNEILLTGERLSPGSELFGVDLARHRAAYMHAILNAHGAQLLDLGCGTGYGTAELADALAPQICVFGLDRVKPAQTSRRADARYLRGDLNGIPLSAGSFDTITSFQVIEHLEDPTRYLEAISRLLRPDGCAYITTPNILTSDKVNPWHVHEYETGELRDILLRHFDDVEMLGVGVGPAVAGYFEERLARIRKIMRLDPLGLRKLLPASAIDWLFATFARLVRRGIQQSEGLPNATVEDFPIGPAASDDIDLLAVCRKPRPRAWTQHPGG